MGLFISNVHIKKNNKLNIDKVSAKFVEMMAAKGIKLADENDLDTVTVRICNPKDSMWMSISTDFFDFNKESDIKAIAEPLSDTLKTDVLCVACFDSDYLFMNLINVNDGVDAWVNIGNCEYIKKQRRTVLEPWKDRITNFNAFKNVLKEKYLFAEEALYACEPLLEMVKGQSVFQHNDIYETLELKFALPEGNKKDLPKLKVWLANYMPCRMDEPNIVFALNEGGKSQGVAIMFMGDFIESDEIKIENVEFLFNKAGIDGKITEAISILPKKVKTESGKTVLYWEDKSFVIPPKVPENLPFGKILDMKAMRSFGVRFTPKGNKRKILDLKVYIFTLENYIDGMACWYAWDGHDSKADFIDFLTENYKDVIENGLLNPEDYDV